MLRLMCAISPKSAVEGGAVWEGLGQTVRAVSFSEGEHAGPIDGNPIEQPQQPVAGEHFLADQSLHPAAEHFLHFVHRQTPEGIVEAVAMWDALDPKPGGKLGFGWTVAPQLILHPPPRSQATNEEEGTDKEQTGQRIRDAIKVAWVDHACENRRPVPPIMLDSAGKRSQEGFLLSFLAGLGRWATLGHGLLREDEL